MRTLLIFNLIGIFITPILSFGNDLFLGGKPIPAPTISRQFTTAEVTDNRSWCTPAIQIGPRTFITAAHCLPALKNVKQLKITGGGISVSSNFIAIASGSLLEDALTGSACETLLQQLKSGDTLTREQMRICWANNGQSDLALLVTDQDIPGLMASIASMPIQKNHLLNQLGYAPGCGGDQGFYRLTALRVFDFINSQVVLDGTGMGTYASDSWTCGGDSGGIYIKENSHQKIEIVGIVTGGTIYNHLTVNISGKNLTLPKNISGGTNLTEPSVRKWLEGKIKENNLDVCGINKDCPELTLESAP